MAVALLVLLVLLVAFGAGGFAVNWLWFLLVALVVIWALGWFLGGPASGPRGYWRRW